MPDRIKEIISKSVSLIKEEQNLAEGKVLRKLFGPSTQERRDRISGMIDKKMSNIETATIGKDLDKVKMSDVTSDEFKKLAKNKHYGDLRSRRNHAKFGGMDLGWLLGGKLPSGKYLTGHGKKKD